MGYDLHGVDGKYFRANIWTWPVIAEMIMETGLIEYPVDIYMNNGDFISGEQACAIADYVEAKLDNNPEIKDFIVRIDNEELYRTNREHIQEFVSFCRNCSKDGFNIW